MALGCFYMLWLDGALEMNIAGRLGTCQSGSPPGAVRINTVRCGYAPEQRPRNERCGRQPPSPSFEREKMLREVASICATCPNHSPTYASRYPNSASHCASYPNR